MTHQEETWPSAVLLSSDVRVRGFLPGQLLGGASVVEDRVGWVDWLHSFSAPRNKLVFLLEVPYPQSDRSGLDDGTDTM